MSSEVEKSASVFALPLLLPLWLPLRCLASRSQDKDNSRFLRFATVATRMTEYELAKDEHRHICDDWNLDQDRIAEARSQWQIRA
jgi:hypothetical protein